MIGLGSDKNTSPYDQDRSSPTLQLLGAPGWWKILLDMIKIDLHKPYNYLVPLEWWKILLHMIKIDLHQHYKYLVSLVGGKYLHI